MTALMFGFFRADLKNPDNKHNDRLIFSKGHAAPLLYALYVAAGAASEQELLTTLRKFGSRFEGHPTMQFPFAEAATGSLGQGLSIGVGMALNAKYLDALPYKTFVLLGDSEMAEGSNWEAMQLASFYKLNNLIAILDVNRLGQRGETMGGWEMEWFERKAWACGWKTIVVDGHNFRAIDEAYVTACKEKKQPVMIIAKTVKGKGVSFLENKEGWHGRALSSSEADEALVEIGLKHHTLRGVVLHPDMSVEGHIPAAEQLTKHTPAYPIGQFIATRKAYGHALVNLFPHHKNMVVLDAEVSNSTEAQIFKAAYPKHFFEMFIAEQNMVGTALGLSRRGKIPFLSTFAAFLTRAHDQIRMCQYSESNIKIVGSHAGVSIGEDGASQMALEDIALFRSLLGSVVLYPSDANATDKLVAAAAAHHGMVYLRMTRRETPVIYSADEQFPIGGSKTIRSSATDKVTVVGAGVTLHEALKAYAQLKDEGVSVRVIDAYSVKPIDMLTLRKAAKETKAIVVVEDHYAEGGIGEAVLSALAGTGAKVVSLAVRHMPQSGTSDELLAYERIDATAIAEEVRIILKK